MMPSAKNTIGRITAENYVPAQGSPYEAQNKSAAFFKQNIMPAIERVMLKFEHVPGIIRIDKLCIDLNLEAWDKNFEPALTKFETRLEELVEEIISKNNETQISAKHQSRAHSQIELFLILIATGQAPWWTSSENIIKLNELATVILQEKPVEFIAQLKPMLHLPNARQRIARGLSDENLNKIISYLFPSSHPRQQLISEFAQYGEETAEAFNQLAPFVYQTALNIEKQINSLPEILVQLISETQNTLPTPAKQLAEYILEDFKSKNVNTDSKIYSANKKQLLPDKVSNTEQTANIDHQSPQTPQTENNTGQQIQNSANAEKNTPKQNETTAEKIVSEEEKIILSTGKNGLQKNLLNAELPENISPQNTSREEKLIENSQEKETLPETKLTESKNIPYLKDEIDTAGNYYINNAGIIILSTFLPSLFKELGLITQLNRFISNEAHEKAVCILHYLLTEDEDFEEHYMLFNKILCGYDLNKPLIYKTVLTQTEKNECANLMDSIALHWTALKNTSPKNIRSAFFWRNGIIKHQGNGWNLKIERTTIDILVDRLPWSISVIKLPWMEDLIFVDWN